MSSTANPPQYETIDQRSKLAAQDVSYLANAVANERALQAHIHLVNLVAERVRLVSHVPKSNKLVDLAVRVDGRPILFEMKSITESNARTQMRAGLSQLYEYRYLQNLPNALLVLVIESELPSNVSWMHQYCETDRQIRLLWDGNDTLHGFRDHDDELAFLDQ